MLMFMQIAPEEKPAQVVPVNCPRCSAVWNFLVWKESPENAVYSQPRFDGNGCDCRLRPVEHVIMDVAAELQYREEETS